jgi:flagellar motor switch protein FliM
MTEILSPEEIAALVEAAKQGQLPEQPSGAGSRRGQRLRTVDFSLPTKFTNDHQRRIARALDTFCQTAATRLSAELRAPIELEVISTAQLTWSAAQAQLPAGSLAVTLLTAPIDTTMLLTAELNFVFMTLECLLGGTPARPVRERRLTEIDWSLTRRLLDSIVYQLSLVWKDLGDVTVSAEEIDIHNDASQIASVSEPTFVVLIEARINKHSSTLALLIPWIAIEPVSEQISGKETRNSEHRENGSSPIHRALAAAPVTLRAEVAAIDMAVEDILALAPGSLIHLGGRADQGVALFAENVQLGTASPGANGPRRAIQLRRSEERST